MKNKIHKAVELYKERKVSLGLGARLAGLSLSEFLDALREHNVTLNLEKEDGDVSEISILKRLALAYGQLISEHAQKHLIKNTHGVFLTLH